MSDLNRSAPYGAFNFIITIDGNPIGGFSEVSGLVTEMTVAEYRAGDYPENHVLKVPGVHKVGDVTLKRGIVNSQDIWGWIEYTRTNGYVAKKPVTIALQDMARNTVQTWSLRGVIPLKYTGPSLVAKGGGDVAMEELVLSCEGYEILTPS